MSNFLAVHGFERASCPYADNFTVLNSIFTGTLPFPVSFLGMPNTPKSLRSMAEQCRALAAVRPTEEGRSVFLRMAEGYEAEAKKRTVSKGG